MKYIDNDEEIKEHTQALMVMVTDYFDEHRLNPGFAMSVAVSVFTTIVSGILDMLKAEAVPKVKAMILMSIEDCFINKSKTIRWGTKNEG